MASVTLSFSHFSIALIRYHDQCNLENVYWSSQFQVVRVHSHLGVEHGSRMLELASWSTGMRCIERSRELPRNSMGFETSKLFTPTPWYTSSNFSILLKQFHQLGIKCSNICAYREGFLIQMVTPPNVQRTGRWGLFQPMAECLLRKDHWSKDCGRYH